MKIQFLGATREVTGSKHLVTTDSGHTILLDCGMYQGKGMETEAANRDLGFDPQKLDCVVLSHAHIDHSGLIPYIVKQGFKGDIFCTPATRDLCALMLTDTAFIQEQDVRTYNKKIDRQNPHKEKGRKYKIEPLYNQQDVNKAMRHFVTYGYDRRFRLFDDVLLTFTNSGHMLGGAVCSLEIYEEDETGRKRWKRLAYTGDIGRLHSHILPSPQLFPQCDYLICESTYGDRLHEEQEVTEEQLLGVVEDTCVYRKGQLLIPSFSVGRTQEIVYVLNRLYNDGRLPHIPVYVDSPMSTNATQIFRMYPDEMSDEVRDTMQFDPDPFGFNTLRYITDIRESKALNHKDEPCIIISASGMLEAGRIKHHVANHISDPRCTILIVGYCEPTTLGARIQEPGLKWISIFGLDRRIKAQITKIEGFSGHGDYREMMDYLTRSLQVESVRRTFVVHGDLSAALAYKDHLAEAGFREVSVPEKGETVTL
ncbi:MAG: MBL fold metallo-hydrolase [Paludibacteraceae bacterium]|nr:MBL fold metallo-hydrolase [Paludibacteraceae bacterium]MBR0064490.1 MBL fold metallo-hydrolase [Paludibacteraceae bacterium]